MNMRKVIHIDEELCDGCGECVPSCAEGAMQIIDGKARLIADKLCDGLGACLGECPQGALSVQEREADAFDEEAVAQHLSAPEQPPPPAPARAPGHACACPGSKEMQFEAAASSGERAASGGEQLSELRQWPIQLHLVSPGAPYFRGADLLLAADCTAFALGAFHAQHLRGKALAIACPKLDEGMEVYQEKLTAMIDQAGLNTMTVLTMQVPCCSGLLGLAQQAAAKAKRKVPIKSVVVSMKGEILSEQWV